MASTITASNGPARAAPSAPVITTGARPVSSRRRAQARCPSIRRALGVVRGVEDEPPRPPMVRALPPARPVRALETAGDVTCFGWPPARRQATGRQGGRGGVPPLVFSWPGLWWEKPARSRPNPSRTECTGAPCACGHPGGSTASGRGRAAIPPLSTTGSARPRTTPAFSAAIRLHGPAEPARSGPSPMEAITLTQRGARGWSRLSPKAAQTRRLLPHRSEHLRGANLQKCHRRHELEKARIGPSGPPAAASRSATGRSS